MRDGIAAELIKELLIDDLLESPAGARIIEAMDTIAVVQRHLRTLSENGDGAELNILRIGTVFQIFLIDTLAAGKDPRELGEEDWKNIAEKVSLKRVLSLLILPTGLVFSGIWQTRNWLQNLLTVRPETTDFWIR